MGTVLGAWLNPENRPCLFLSENVLENKKTTQRRCKQKGGSRNMKSSIISLQGPKDSGTIRGTLNAQDHHQ